jgi:hypothetical protein
MTAPNYEQGTADLDRLLNDVGAAVELTPEQKQRAHAEYIALASWLSEPGTLLGRLRVDVYPQGSKRIGTEVRPLDQYGGDACQHDLDAVAESMFSELTAMQQYDAMYDRLAANPRYWPHLERKKRCVRINFPGEFHLDVLPARKDRSRPNTTCIQIPDCERKAWTTSNPKGYALWFEERGATAREAFAKAMRLEALRKAVDPLPSMPSFSEKPVLNRVVQLMKRRRDIVFKGAATAPRSIILTTLAARYYDGEIALFPALLKVVTAIRIAVDQARPARIEVRNPTDERENFADAWGRDDVAYQAFIDFVHKLEKDLIALGTTTGIERVIAVLEGLFGAAPVQKAYRSFREEMRKAADGGSLRVRPGHGLLIGGSAGLSVPRSTHYGAADDARRDERSPALDGTRASLDQQRPSE